MAMMSSDAASLPRIDTRYGEKCAALLWQLQQQQQQHSEPALEQPSSNRKSALATRYGLAIPKSAGYRGAPSPGSASDARQLQRLSSTRAVAKRPSGGQSTLSRPKLPSQRWEDDSGQTQQLEAAQPDSSRAFSSPRSFAGGGDRYAFSCETLREFK